MMGRIFMEGSQFIYCGNERHVSYDRMRAEEIDFKYARDLIFHCPPKNTEYWSRDTWKKFANLKYIYCDISKPEYLKLFVEVLKTFENNTDINITLDFSMRFEEAHEVLPCFELPETTNDLRIATKSFNSVYFNRFFDSLPIKLKSLQIVVEDFTKLDGREILNMNMQNIPPCIDQILIIINHFEYAKSNEKGDIVKDEPIIDRLYCRIEDIIPASFLGVKHKLVLCRSKKMIFWRRL